MRHLKPGIPIFALHGGMPQLRRVEVYNQFMWKQRVCLFATDIAARGLGNISLFDFIYNSSIVYTWLRKSSDSPG
jgi:superfamily II DNA/RNA helicase